jgi:hypothetical protein
MLHLWKSRPRSEELQWKALRIYGRVILCSVGVLRRILDLVRKQTFYSNHNIWCYIYLLSPQRYTSNKLSGTWDNDAHEFPIGEG